jgi:hypothetical protein
MHGCEFVLLAIHGCEFLLLAIHGCEFLPLSDENSPGSDTSETNERLIRCGRLWTFANVDSFECSEEGAAGRGTKNGHVKYGGMCPLIEFQ